MISDADSLGWKRDGAGRWAKGTRPGPGAPRRKSSALRRALKRTCTALELEAVLRALLAAAKGGDVPAIKVLLDVLERTEELAVIEERLRALEVNYGRG